MEPACFSRRQRDHVVGLPFNTGGRAAQPDQVSGLAPRKFVQLAEPGWYRHAFARTPERSLGGGFLGSCGSVQSLPFQNCLTVPAVRSSIAGALGIPVFRQVPLAFGAHLVWVVLAPVFLPRKNFTLASLIAFRTPRQNSIPVGLVVH